MSDITKITEALTVVETVETLVHAEAVNMGGRKTDVDEMAREMADSTTAHDEIAGHMKSITEYLRRLHKMMQDAELPTKNEALAVEQAEKLERESLDIIADLESVVGFLKLANVMLENAADKSENMSEHAKELLKQMKVVMERP